MSKKWVYLFTEVEDAIKAAGDWEGVRALLGGKGANLAEMTRIDCPSPQASPSPPKPVSLTGRWKSVPRRHVGTGISRHARRRRATGKKFGDPSNPCSSPAALVLATPCPV
jgi:pyruvate, orthophosphate dikinase